MKFKGDGMRRSAAAALAALMLAACGGGDQVSPFVPSRVLAFGDENSVIVPSGVANVGNKFTINDVGLTCETKPIWVQALATAYGLVFEECPGTVVAPASRILARAGEGATDVAAQIDGFLAGPDAPFGETDLVTVFAGTKDVIDQFDAIVAGATEAQALTALDQAGSVLAAQVNRIGNAGGKVLVLLVPDVNLTPYGVAESADNQALLNRLTTQFNNSLRTGLINDARMIGLVQADVMVRNTVAVQGSFVDVTRAACSPDDPLVPNCTTDTMATDVGVNLGSDWLWADSRHLSATGHASLGELAIARARANPF